MGWTWRAGLARCCLCKGGHLVLRHHAFGQVSAWQPVEIRQPGRLVDSLEADVRNEGNRQPVIVELYNLDAGPVLTYIDGLQKNTPRYQIARNNCSHIVANALMAGAKRGPSFIPNAGHYGHMARILGLGIWTPDQVLRFAKELKFV
ncbi:MAG: hypothetical protein RL748_1264 [Pseudomonadota bacterium]|jgi:hypothetical protein